jgi:prevent-host-death family protein
VTRIVNVHEAKTHLSRLLDDVEAGEEIVLDRSGRPCERLVPLAPVAGRKLGVIAAQAVVLGLPVATKDVALKLFPCRTVW